MYYALPSIYINTLLFEQEFRQAYTMHDKISRQQCNCLTCIASQIVVFGARINRLFHIRGAELENSACI